MPATRGNIILANVLKRGLRSVLPRFSAFYTTLEQTNRDDTDLQIQELNQEIQGVFGPDGTDSNTSPFSNITSSCTDACRGSRESAGHVFKGSSTCDFKMLTHVDNDGKATMVDVSLKKPTRREAKASGKVLLGPEAFQLVYSNQISKGDVLTVAKLAGICAAKQTGSLIPLCHNIILSNVQLNIELDIEERSALIKAEVTSIGLTGVEMEALTAVSVAALTVFDMCKSVSKHISINNIQLESKTGGKSGEWHRGQDTA